MNVSSVNTPVFTANNEKQPRRSFIGVVAGSLCSAGTWAYGFKNMKNPAARVHISPTNIGIISSILILLGYAADRFIDIKKQDKFEKQNPNQAKPNQPITK